MHGFEEIQNLELFKVIRKILSQEEFSSVCIQTENLNNYIEKLMPTCSDRGNYKYIAETRDFKKLHIDDSDCFPRYYFSIDCLIAEILLFMYARKELLVGNIMVFSSSINKFVCVCSFQ